jgi:two-component SAPR family response regulator
MRVICVDDERLLMEDTVSMCLELPEIADVKGFVKSREALEWFEQNHVDIALLDIDMPEMNGIELARRIKTISPDTAVIFMTGYEQYAVDAFKVRASGYILKPVTKEALEADISYLMNWKTGSLRNQVNVRTFGTFEVYVNGSQVKFRLAKAKEILAYFVDRQGGSVTRAEIASILWEDRAYDRKMQKQLDVYLRSLRNTLTEYGILHIVEAHRGTYRIVPDKIDCDFYRFLAGDADTINSYRGEYMSSYSWASATEGMLFQINN